MRTMKKLAALLLLVFCLLGAALALADTPTYSATSWTEMDKVLKDAKKNKITEFTVQLSSDFYSEVNQNSMYTLRRKLIKLGAECNSIWYSSWYNTVTFHSSDLTWSNIPAYSVTTKAKLKEALQSASKKGYKKYYILMSEKLYNAMSKNSFEDYYTLCGQCRIAYQNFSYNWSRHYLTVNSSEYHKSNAKYVTTVAEAEAFLKKMAASQAKNVYLFCSPSLFNKLYAEKNNGMGSKITRMQTMTESCGLMDMQWSNRKNTHLISLEKIKYYPGFRIYNAVKNGTEKKLSSSDKKVLKAARTLVKNATKSSNLSKFKLGTKQSKTVAAIMEAINKKVKYTTNDNSNRDDCAIGALLDGKANCDGYTDAFYLCANLAGLSAQYQHGTNKESDKWDSITHIWNKVKVNGKWYFVDCTWCDTDAKESGYVQNNYSFFLLGKDYAKKYYIWFDDFGSVVEKKTNFDLSTYAVYRVNSASKAKSAIDKALKAKYKEFVLLYTGSGKMLVSTITNYLYQKGNRISRYAYSGENWGTNWHIKVTYR